MINFDYASVRPLEHLIGRALSSYQGIQHSYLLAKHALAVQGAFVECGVAFGGSAAAMLTAMVDAGDVRALHLFDSFQGIPLAGPKDEDQPGLGKGRFIADVNLPLDQRLVTSGISACPISEVQRHFNEWGLPLSQVHFHQGWFQDTLPGNRIGDIAMLRLDGDLYESIECCMKWLYPKVVPGGIVLSDDWNLIGGCDAIRDYFGDNMPDIRVTVDTGACYWVKP